MTHRDTTDAASDAWRTAASELGVRVTAPCEVSAHRFVAFLPDFGGDRGMVVGLIGAQDPGAMQQAAHQDGLYLSLVAPDAYARFDRNLFTETLNDWGWYGADEEPPAWYTGAPWTLPGRSE